MLENHVTLRDVSVIEKANEIDHAIPNSDLSVSLLPYVPATNAEEDKPNNKSVASTISDKTFVKTSHTQFSSDEEATDDSDEDESTVIEESFISDRIENERPLLLTADRSIRRPISSVPKEKNSLANLLNIVKPKIKQEQNSFRELLSSIEYNRSNKTLLLNSEKSNEIRRTIIDHPNISKLLSVNP